VLTVIEYFSDFRLETLDDPNTEASTWIVVARDWWRLSSGEANLTRGKLSFVRLVVALVAV
jgi:hypothetical protein